MAVGCYPCMDFYFGQAEKEGLSKEEIGAIESIVMAVSAGRVQAQVRDVRDGK